MALQLICHAGFWAYMLNFLWLTHANHVSNKLCTGIYMLRMLRASLCIDSLLSVYYAHIHSHMSYGLLFWANHGMASRVFKLQKRATITISGDSQRTHCRPLFTKYRILTLYSMYVLSCLLCIKTNIINYAIVSSVRNYQTRNRMNVWQDKSKYTLTQNIFHYNSVKLYNSVPQA
ncbi:hypothetical protein C0J52_11177 [Blattella germanica]|nr:hypothetical protein C0J52_11177 [Blattella germanica]